MPKIKICGLTNYKDALDAVNLGADFIGFNLIKDSPKKISLKSVADIISKTPPFISTVGIFDAMDTDLTLSNVKKCGFKYIQFNGNETPEICQAARSNLEVKVIKSFSIKKDIDGTYPELSQIDSFIGSIDYLILDISYLDGDIMKLDFEAASQIKNLEIPYFITVKTNIDDISEIIEKTSAFGIEADTILDRLPTRKDHDKLIKFIKTAKSIKF
jgi:phosphoribosylanthranilate isomerase